MTMLTAPYTATTNSPFASLLDAYVESSFPRRFDVEQTAVPAQQPISRSQLTNPAEIVVPLVPTSRGRARSRLRMLRRLPTNHDGEGAQAPDANSVDSAIAFLDRLPAEEFLLVPTLSADGEAVIEFRTPLGVHADITFCDRGQRLACYWKSPGQPSLFAEGPPSQVDVRKMLRDCFQAEV